MKKFTSFSSSSSSPHHHPSPLSHIPPISAACSSAAFNDSSDDSCSICLEPFSINDPSTITCCKHEYHLHCILEWSQRSKECPICWQLLALRDPASQEVLAAVAAERRLRSRSRYSSSFANSRSHLGLLNHDHDDSCSDNSDLDEQIMQQQLAAAAGRARLAQRQERQRSSGAGLSEALVFNSSMHVSRVQPTLAPSPPRGRSPASGAPSVVETPPSRSSFSPLIGDVTRNTAPESDVPFKPRVLYCQQPPGSARRLNSSEMFSIPESIKSKFSAASARYKESISKSTRGLKEKLLARNASIKELSKGIQQEVNAGIAGVTRMIGRLDLTSKRSPLITVVGTGGTSGFPVEGKSVEENGSGHSSNVESGEGVVHGFRSDAPSLVSSSAVQLEVPRRVQNGHGAVKTT